MVLNELFKKSFILNAGVRFFGRILGFINDQAQESAIINLFFRTDGKNKSTKSNSKA